MLVPLSSGARGKGKTKQAAAAVSWQGPNSTPVGFRDPCHQRQAQAGAGGNVGGIAGASVFLKDDRGLPFRDSHTAVGDVQRDLWTRGVQTHLELLAIGGVADGIGQQIGNGRHQRLGIRLDHRQVVVDGDFNREALILEHGFELSQRGMDDPGNIGVNEVPRLAAALHA